MDSGERNDAACSSSITAMVRPNNTSQKQACASAVICHLWCLHVVPQDHTYSFDTESAKGAVELLKQRIANVEREKRNALQREKRAKQKCEDILKELHEKILLTAELEDKLSAYQG